MQGLKVTLFQKKRKEKAKRERDFQLKPNGYLKKKKKDEGEKREN